MMRIQHQTDIIKCRKCTKETNFKLSNYIKGFQQFIIENNPYFYCNDCTLKDELIKYENCILCNSYIFSKLGFINYTGGRDWMGNKEFNGVKCLLCVSNEAVKKKEKMSLSDVMSVEDRETINRALDNNKKLKKARDDYINKRNISDGAHLYKCGDPKFNIDREIARSQVKAVLDCKTAEEMEEVIMNF